MKGSKLVVYVANQSQRKNHMTVVEWLLDEARQIGIQGATVVDASKGVDTHGMYHSAHFFELVDQPVIVTIIGEDDRIDTLLDKLQTGGVKLFYTRASIEYGAISAGEDR